MKKKLLILIPAIAIVTAGILLLIFKNNKITATFTVDNKIYEVITDIKKGTTIEAPKVPVKEGYTFLGWYADGEEYDFSKEVNSKVKLEAKFEINTYTIYIDNKIDQITTIQKKYGEKLEKLSSIERAGYSFLGWYVGEEEYDFSKVIRSDLVIEAKWLKLEATAHEVNYYPSDNTNNVDSRQTTYSLEHYYMNLDGTYNEKADEVEVLGNEIGTNLELKAKVKDGFVTPKNISVTTSDNGIMVVKYYYEREKYTIIFDGKNDSEVIKKTYYYEQEIDSIADPTRDNYDFDGWYLDDNYQISYDLKIMPSHDVIVYAKWNPIEYSITYELNGGSFETEVKRTYTVESENFVLNVPVKDDYAFVGWTGSNGDTPEVKVTITKGSSGDKNYIANWGKSIRDLDITVDSKSLVYDKTEKYAIVTVKDGELVLTENVDYKLDYKDNINAGEAVVTITMLGSTNNDNNLPYTGSVDMTFTIAKKVLTVDKFIYNNLNKEYDGTVDVTTDIEIIVTDESGLLDADVVNVIYEKAA